MLVLPAPAYLVAGAFFKHPRRRAQAEQLREAAETGWAAAKAAFEARLLGGA